MPAMDRSIDAYAVAMEYLRDVVRRRLREGAGGALVAMSALATLTLATWSVQDPSLSHATAAHVRNILGLPGAVVADLLMQLVGVASVAVFMPLGFWGWRLMTHRPIGREWLRVGLWLVGVVAAAAFASCLPRTAHWPLPTGLGGVFGDALLRAPATIAGPLAGWPLLIVGAIAGAAATVMLGIASGFGHHHDGDAAEPADEHDADPEDETSDESRPGAISLGFLTHGLLSLKARLSRLLRRRVTRPAGAALRLRQRLLCST
jgi:S-DNA-T family DNA segregation ATPase FtsK/SpoIIIE